MKLFPIDSYWRSLWLQKIVHIFVIIAVYQWLVLLLMTFFLRRWWRGEWWYLDWRYRPPNTTIEIWLLLRFRWQTLSIGSVQEAPSSFLFIYYFALVDSHISCEVMHILFKEVFHISTAYRNSWRGICCSSNSCRSLCWTYLFEI